MLYFWLWINGAIMEQTLLNWLFGSVMAILGWLGKTLWDAVQELKNDMKDIEVNLPKDYVSKEDYKSDIKDIKDMLKELYDMHRNRTK